MKNNKLSRPAKLRIKKIKNVNGILIPLYFDKIRSFKAKRMFIVKGHKNFIRGQHAHKKCTQIIVQIEGEIEIIVINKKKYKFNLKSTQNKILRIPPMNWVNIKFKKNNSSFLVLCDVNFSKNEYIYNFSEFEKRLRSNV
tara:strand:- start:880 stop:1299 length:420 start_codon:yes stop_codon:yes gene_type:complete